MLFPDSGEEPSQDSLDPYFDEDLELALCLILLQMFIMNKSYLYEYGAGIKFPHCYLLMSSKFEDSDVVCVISQLWCKKGTLF
jgi:hypothetical protein